MFVCWSSQSPGSIPRHTGTAGANPATGILIASVASAPYTSSLAQALSTDVLERFERYARIDTQSRRDRDQSPSTPGQLELGSLLAGELRDAGLDDAEIDDNGYVTATLQSNNGQAPVIGLIAHLDTSPDPPG